MDDLRIHTRLLLPAGELHESASRSGGPGGQHVNKASTRVTLRWPVPDSPPLSDGQRHRLLSRLRARLTRRGELVVHAGGMRSRSRNREQARERLAEIVRAGLATRAKRVASRPSSGSRERRLTAKKQRANVKQLRRPPNRGD